MHISKQRRHSASMPHRCSSWAGGCSGRNALESLYKDPANGEKHYEGLQRNLREKKKRAVTCGPMRMKEENIASCWTV